MLPRAVLLRRLKASSASACLPASLARRPLALTSVRYVANSTTSTTTPGSSTPQGEKGEGKEGEKVVEKEKSWLTRKVEASPTARAAFLAVAKALGYGSPRQLAGRRAFVLYENICAVKPDHDLEFWQKREWSCSFLLVKQRVDGGIARSRFAFRRMSFAAYVPVVVYGDKLACLVAYRAAARVACRARPALRPSAH